MIVMKSIRGKSPTLTINNLLLLHLGMDYTLMIQLYISSTVVILIPYPHVFCWLKQALNY